VRGRSSTVIWTKYCGTAAKAGGNRENKPDPVVMGVSCLLENSGILGLMDCDLFKICGIVIKVKLDLTPLLIPIVPIFQYSNIPIVNSAVIIAL
jgi:hypothetical protein